MFDKGMDTLFGAYTQMRKEAGHLSEEVSGWTTFTKACYLFEEPYECDTFQLYNAVAEWVDANDFDAVFDIGCAGGYQGEFFKLHDIKYFGINDHDTGYFYRNAWNQYIIQKYPFSIKSTNAVAISNFCLGYFGNNDAKAKQLAEDFETVVIGNTNDTVLYDVYGKYFEITIERYHVKQSFDTNMPYWHNFYVLNRI